MGFVPSSFSGAIRLMPWHNSRKLGVFGTCVASVRKFGTSVSAPEGGRTNDKSGGIQE